MKNSPPSSTHLNTLREFSPKNRRIFLCRLLNSVRPQDAQIPFAIKAENNQSSRLHFLPDGRSDAAFYFPRRRENKQSDPSPKRSADDGSGTCSSVPTIMPPLSAVALSATTRVPEIFVKRAHP